MSSYGRDLQRWSDHHPGSGVVRALLGDPGFQAVLLYRLARWFRSRGIPFFGPFFTRLSVLLTGIEIGPGAEIGGGLSIRDGAGTVIGGHAHLGQDVEIRGAITVGATSAGRRLEMPRIGDRVRIEDRAAVIGGIVVGDDAVIGTGAILSRDLPAGSEVRAPAPPGNRS